jgi:uncharacterized protein YdcH (DUF465 family)
MSIEHHDLLHDLPEYKEAIHELKLKNAHFKKLFNQYHLLTREVENMENNVIPVATEIEEQAKFRRVKLKDELVEMLKKTELVSC